MSRGGRDDPFAALGLTAGPGLTDDDVRAAWRRIAAATHPDRADGGDPGRFAAAAAAYSVLRTGAGRGEALADRAEHAPRRRGRGQVLPAAASLARRVRHGRPGLLALRAAAAAAVGAAAIAVAGLRPAAAGVIAGALTWLLLTGRHDLAPRAARRGSPPRQRPARGA